MKKKVFGILSITTITIASIATSTLYGHAAEPNKFDAVYKVAPSNDIKNKMLNSIDYFKDAQGTVSYNEQIGKQDISFKVKEGKSPASYIKILSPTDGSVESEYFNDASKYTIYNDKKNTVMSNSVPKGDIPIDQQKAEERSYKNKDQQNVYIERNNPADSMNIVSVLFPQQFAFWLDDFTHNYKVTGHESILGRDATVIDGQLPEGLAQKHKATNFRFWVDTQTGILLKENETDSNGNIVNSIEIKNLVLNSDLKLDKSEMKVPANAVNLDTDISNALSK